MFPPFLARAARRWVWPLLAGWGYFLAAIAGLFLTRQTEGIATIWPASGVLLAALLLADRRDAWRFIGTAAVASMAANMMWYGGMATSLGFSVANCLDALMAATIFAGRRQEQVSFLIPQRLRMFCLAATVGAVVSAGVATMASPDGSATFFLSWACTDLLGMLIVTPMIVIAVELMHHRHRFRPRPAQVGEAIVLLSGIGGAAALVFFQTTYPLLYLPFAGVLFVVFRLGAFGAAASVLIVTLVSSLATAANHGPLAMLPDGPVFGILFLQIYLLLMFAAALPTASLLGWRDRLIRQLAEKNEMLQLAERTAHVGHWRLDTRSGEMFCSEEIFAIYGRNQDIQPTTDLAIAAYHIDDRAFVVAQIRASVTTALPFDFRARLIRANGEIRHVISKGWATLGPDGKTSGIFGTMQDITEQVTAELALDEARSAAERMAWDATRMAETDYLTGVFSRRKILQILDQSIDSARLGGGALTVVTFDIDHFKRVNDEHGHAAGDRVLQRVASAVASSIRPQDFVGRVGGEEFIIVLPGAPIDVAEAVGERVRSVVFHGAEGPLIVTISLGVAAWEPASTAEQLLGRADAALYDAKHAGRNMLRVAA
ncbi:hypothetical protein ASG67_01450 [Sphingomonas sp. Leaf339]|uniref:sensor domain-containing diguanylate cyclase n=1 Tax=Sphingomonas sp. Leaf339 TaxID=1736343 RepID=UPI0006FD5B49|nr:sensor domain-containing diguanylate cyclase [Sphingomonas sp. Leaf339]KQU61863.1 hypothetical protein ASG67_01450 [Sphingomonas sp. Leaf339]